VEALGDYCAGPNHVLPTMRSARFSSPLGAPTTSRSAPASSLIHPSSFSLIAPERGTHHLLVTGFYLAATLASLVGVSVYRRRFNFQLNVHVLVDIGVLTLLMNFGGGVRSGMGILLLVSLAGSGLVGHGRLVLFYAATATLAVLYEQTYRAITTDFAAADFFQTGLCSARAFSASRFLARLMARRVIANEELARKRGIELRNQTLVSQRIIEQMQDGVLVIDRDGMVGRTIRARRGCWD
jgi:two-component system sensor histidine kinase PilS (NtrC family)